MDCRAAQEKMMPFIRRQLNDEELEQFVRHIDSCQECYEELQISYSLYQGLRMLEQDQLDSFHIQHGLDRLLQDSREKVQKRHRIKKAVFWITVGALAGVFLFFAMQLIRWLNPELFHRMIPF